MASRLRPSEREDAVVLALRRHDAKNQLRAYRVFHWLRSFVDARLDALDGGGVCFVLPEVKSLIKVTAALDELVRGELVAPQRSLMTPHFANPIDEAISCQNGKRTFMKHMEAQEFMSVNGGKRELLAALQVRNPCVVDDKVSEAAIGSLTRGRWDRVTRPAHSSEAAPTAAEAPTPRRGGPSRRSPP